MHFFEELLALTLRWFHAALEARGAEHAIEGFEGICSCVASCATATTGPLSRAEATHAVVMLCQTALSAASMAFQHPSSLSAAEVSLQQLLPGAQAALTGKLMRLEPAVVKALHEPLRLLSSLRGTLGVTSFDTLSEAAAKQVLSVEEGLGIATCCAQLAAALSVEGWPEAEREAALFLPASIAAQLRHMGRAVCTLTDVAARHQSMVIALVPLLAVVHWAKHERGVSAGLDEEYVDLLDPTLSVLVLVMSHNPVEIVRTSAYEALNTLLDAMDPSARLLVLRRLLNMDSTAAAVVALQRLRLEISQAVLPEGLSHQVALQLALPYLQHGDPPGWRNEADVMRSADVMAAAASVCRFVLLQRLASGRNEKPIDARQLPFLLQINQLRKVVEDGMRPLHAGLGRSLQMQQRVQKESGGEESMTEVFLATLRLEDVLARTIEASEQLMKACSS